MECVLAIDPGSEKTGLAVVDKKLGTCWRAIVNSDDVGREAQAAIERFKCTSIVIGDGTYSDQIKKHLCFAIEKDIIITAVSERNSTHEARARFWRENPPHGWRRIIPTGLLTLPTPVDDWAAVILAERYFAEKKL